MIANLVYKYKAWHLLKNYKDLTFMYPKENPITKYKEEMKERELQIYSLKQKEQKMVADKLKLETK